MGTKSRDRLYSTSVRIAAGRAAEARRQADLSCEAWTKRMLAFKGPAQPSPTLGDALDAGYTYLGVRCLVYFKRYAGPEHLNQGCVRFVSKLREASRADRER